MDKDKVQFNMNMSAKLKKRLDAVAKKHGTTASFIMELALEREVERLEKEKSVFEQ